MCQRMAQKDTTWDIWQVQKQVRFALDMTRQDSNAQFLGSNG